MPPQQHVYQAFPAYQYQARPGVCFAVSPGQSPGDAYTPSVVLCPSLTYHVV